MKAKVDIYSSKEKLLKDHIKNKNIIKVKKNKKGIINSINININIINNNIYHNTYKLIIVLIMVLSYILLEKKILYQRDKISIIIPTYNRGHLISKSINSVLSQTYQNIEVIIIDDNSNDNTTKIVNDFKDKRIRYIKLRKNKGAAFARNFGIKKSIGEYISFQDSDDICHINKIEIQLKNLLNNKSDLDFCKMGIRYYNGLKKTFPSLYQEKGLLKDGIFNELSRENFIGTPAILVKKSIMEKFLFDTSLPALEDYDFVLRIASKINITYTNKILYEVYRLNQSMTSNSIKMKKANEMILHRNYGFDSIHQKIFNNRCQYFIQFFETMLKLNKEYSL